MNLHLIDALIIGAYLTATIAIGFWIAKRASRIPSLICLTVVVLLIKFRSLSGC